MVAAVFFACFTLLCGANYAVSEKGIVDTKGDTFTMAFFPEYIENGSSKLRNYLYLASRDKGLCTVTYNDGSRRSSDVSLIAGEVVEKALPDTTQMANVGTGIEPKAIYMSCNHDIALHGLNKYSDNGDVSEAFTVLPNKMLSKEYFIASLNKTAFIGVVALGNTHFSVFLKSTCDYQFNNRVYKSGDIMNITLSYYDVFRLGGTTDTTNNHCDLTGTVIRSSEPVAVFTGALYYRGTSSSQDANGHLVLQVPPLTDFSQTVIVPSTPDEISHRMFIQITAGEDNTRVDITSENTTSGVKPLSQYRLNSGETLDFSFNPDINVIIQSNAPVMVSQRILGVSNGGGLMFIPGVNQYENSFLIRSLKLDASGKTVVTVVTETTATGDLRVDGIYPKNVTWTNLSTVPYSVGIFDIAYGPTYNISSTSPLLVRVVEEAGLESFGYIAGFKIGNDTTIDTVKAAVSLTCLPGGWNLTLDVSKLILDPTDASHIYLSKDSCTGSLLGDQLFFNVSYHECQTTTSVTNGTIIYRNTLLYAPPSADHLVRDIIWRHNVKCSMPVDGTDTVHIYPGYNKTGNSETSGVIHESSVHIALYKDSTYRHPVEGSVIKANIGQPVYVQVTSPGNQYVVMVVHACDAHLEDDKHVSYPLIENGCTVDPRTQILVSRNQVTRFKFEMFDIQNERDGIYVTCHVTFCDPMDFSAKCQQQCQTSPHIVG